MTGSHPVNIIMIEDDDGHARLIEKNIRRAGILNDIKHFTDGTQALHHLFEAEDGPAKGAPALILLTSQGERPPAEQLLAHNIFACEFKPISESHLHDLVRDLSPPGLHRVDHREERGTPG